MIQNWTTFKCQWYKWKDIISQMNKNQILQSFLQSLFIQMTSLTKNVICLKCYDWTSNEWKCVWSNYFRSDTSPTIGRNLQKYASDNHLGWYALMIKCFFSFFQKSRQGNLKGISPDCRNISFIVHKNESCPKNKC